MTVFMPAWGLGFGKYRLDTMAIFVEDSVRRKYCKIVTGRLSSEEEHGYCMVQKVLEWVNKLIKVKWNPLTSSSTINISDYSGTPPKLYSFRVCS